MMAAASTVSPTDTRTEASSVAIVLVQKRDPEPRARARPCSKSIAARVGSNSSVQITPNALVAAIVHCLCPIRWAMVNAVEASVSAWPRLPRRERAELRA